jgi:ankyrin repeat protein
VQDSMGEMLMATACRVGNFEVFEKLLKAGADVSVVRRDGTSALQLAIVSGNARMLNCMLPKMIENDESAESSYVHCLSLAFLAPTHISRWLKDGRSASARCRIG